MYSYVCALVAIQYTTISTAAKGLDGENGLERCLPPNPYPLKPSTPSPIHLGGEALQVSVPPIWCLLIPPEFSQNY